MNKRLSAEERLKQIEDKYGLSVAEISEISGQDKFELPEITVKGTTEERLKQIEDKYDLNQNNKNNKQKKKENNQNILQAIGHAGLQGISLGFADELGLQNWKNMSAAQKQYPLTSWGVETAASMIPEIAASIIPGGRLVKTAAKYAPSMIHGAGVAMPDSGTRAQGAFLGGLGAKVGDFIGRSVNKLFPNKASKQLEDKAIESIGINLGLGKHLLEDSAAWRTLNRDIGAAWNVANLSRKNPPSAFGMTYLPRPKLFHNIRGGFPSEDIGKKIKDAIGDRMNESKAFKQGSAHVDRMKNIKNLRLDRRELKNANTIVNQLRQQKKAANKPIGDFMTDQIAKNKRMIEAKKLRIEQLRRGQDPKMNFNIYHRAQAVIDTRDELKESTQRLEALNRIKGHITDSQIPTQTFLKDLDNKLEQDIRQQLTIAHDFRNKRVDMKDLQSLANKRDRNKLQDLIRGGFGHGAISLFSH